MIGTSPIVTTIDQMKGNDSVHWKNPSSIFHIEKRRAQVSIWLPHTGNLWQIYRPRDRKKLFGNNSIKCGSGLHKLHQQATSQQRTFCDSNYTSGAPIKYHVSSKFTEDVQQVSQLIYDLVSWNHWELGGWFNSTSTYSQGRIPVSLHTVY